MNSLIPCYIKLLSQDLDLWPFKIISLISNKAKRLGGVNMGYSQEKNIPSWPTTKNSFVSFDPTRARTYSGELTVWFRDSSLNLLSPGQTELQYIHEERQIFIENCLCFIQLVLLCEQKSCTYQKVVWNKFLQLERLCEQTFTQYWACGMQAFDLFKSQICSPMHLNLLFENLRDYMG